MKTYPGATVNSTRYAVNEFEYNNGIVWIVRDTNDDTAFVDCLKCGMLFNDVIQVKEWSNDNPLITVAKPLGIGIVATVIEHIRQIKSNELSRGES